MNTQDVTRVIVVTGGSRGIGRAITLRMAAPNVGICINYSSQDSADADETIRLAEQAGASGLCARADVSSKQEVDALFQMATDKWGRVDVLVNNAGITRDGLMIRMKEEDWDRVLDVNLKGAFNCMQAATKWMIKQRSGFIINITSIVGAMGSAGQANYAASKAGLIGLTKTAAQELASRGITVNAVAPGFIETAMTEQLNEKLRALMLARIPAGRFGQPKEVADVVAFLASSAANYITGQVVHVNGGMYM